MKEITRIITPCRCGKCIYCEFGGNPPAQIIEKETVCGDCERKDKLIEQLRDALKLVLEGAIHDFHYVCQHQDNCLCWGCQKKRIKAALSAAERGRRMKKMFVVTRYEVHEFPVIVEAEDALDAVERVCAGEGEQPDDVSKYVTDTYIEIDDSRGKAFDEFVSEFPEIDRSRVAMSREFDNNTGMFPTIRSVYKVKGGK